MWRIGDWQVDDRTNEIARGDDVVRIEPKAMDVLVMIARHAGQVVAREALLDALWPGVVVGDEALTQAVIKLRRALGDDSRVPRYIETIPKRGYRLIAPVSAEALPPAAGPRPARRTLAAVGLAGAVLVALTMVQAGRDEAVTPAVRRVDAARNVEAQESFDRGQALLLVRRAAENEEARASFRKAIELDPAFARAYAGLAMTFALDSRLGGRDGSARALELAQTARLIDPSVPDAHWVLGFVYAQDRRHRQAIASLQKAIELDGAYADAYALLGGVYTYIGRPAQSIPLLRTAMRLNREAGYLYFLLLGRAYLFEGDPEQAMINLREAARRNPVDIETRAYLAAALVAAGELSAARWEGDEVRALQAGFSSKRWLAAYPMTDERQKRRLAMLLADAGL